MDLKEKKEHSAKNITSEGKVPQGSFSLYGPVALGWLSGVEKGHSHGLRALAAFTRR